MCHIYIDSGTYVLWCLKDPETTLRTGLMILRLYVKKILAKITLKKSLGITLIKRENKVDY